MLDFQQLPSLRDDVGGLGQWDDHHANAIGNDDVPRRDRNPRALDGHIDLAVACDGADVGHDALAEHREAELEDPLDVSARTVDDGLFSDDHLVPRYLNQVSLYTRNGSAFHIRLGEDRLQ